MIQQLLKNKIFLYVVLGILAFLVFGGLLKKLGIFRTPEQKAYSKVKSDNKIVKAVVDSSLGRNLAFDPKYHRSFPSTQNQLLQAQNLALKMHKAMRFFGTRESDLLGALDAVKSRVEMSRVADAYYKAQGKSLINEIISELNKADRVKALTMIKDLPNNTE